MKPDSRRIIRKADRYLRSAELLLRDGDLDSSASRLYYAMFYCAVALLSTKGLSYSTHKGVISAFGERFVKTGLMPAPTHQWLREAFDQRLAGDYDWEAELSAASLRNLLEHARHFRDLAASRLEEPPLLGEPPASYDAGKPRPKRRKRK